MNSVRENLIAEVMKRITSALSGVAVIRQPTVPVGRGDGNALLVFVDRDVVSHRSNCFADRELTLRLVSVVRGNRLFADADRQAVRAHAALMSDPTLGGLAISVRESDSEWNPDDADYGALSLPAVYEIRYRTLINDISKIKE